MKFSTVELSEAIAALMLGGTLLLGALTLALRFGLRPVMQDWAKGRSEFRTAILERRLVELEDEIRQLKAATGLQLPAEVLRSSDRPRT